MYEQLSLTARAKKVTGIGTRQDLVMKNKGPVSRLVHIPKRAGGDGSDGWAEETKHLGGHGLKKEIK